MTCDVNSNKILIIAYKYLRQDPRILREIDALLDAGFNVHVICPKSNDYGANGYRENPNIEIFASPLERHRGNKIRYVFEYLIFFCFVALKATKLYWKFRYKMIQVFAMPEALVLACLVPKIFGSAILMDWEDPMKEVFLSIYKGRSNRIFLFFIYFFEMIAVRLADRIIVPNLAFIRAFVKRGYPKEKFSVVMNAADERIFFPNSENNIASIESVDPIVLYTGIIVQRGGLDLAINAMKLITAEIPAARLVVLGDGKQEYVDLCMSLTKELGLEDTVFFKGRVDVNELPEAITGATVGIIPNPSNEFTNINFPTRISEYATLKLPMILPRLPGIQDYFNEKSACFFQPDNSSDLARCVIKLFNDQRLCESLAIEAKKISRKISWARQKANYLQIVNNFYYGH